MHKLKTENTKYENMKTRKLAVIFGTTLLTVAAAMAQQLGIDFNDPAFAISSSAGEYNSYYTFGYEFQVTSQVTVNGLATYDITPGGLLQAVQVGLWADNGNGVGASGNLLASAIVPAGTLPSGGSLWAEVAITPMVLSPGFYDVGSYDTSDSWTAGTPVTASPGISYVQDRYSQSDSFTYPNITENVPLAQAGWFGGNIVLANSVAVPEPATWALILSGVGLAGLGASVRSVPGWGVVRRKTRLI
jgi:hypothetical protein